MINKIFKVVMLVLLVGAIAYAGMCAYGNFIASEPSAPGSIKMPESKDAAYSLVVKNTATVMLTNEYEQIGDTAGERTFILHGFWELVGSEFYFNDRDIILQETVFGEITLKKR